MPLSVKNLIGKVCVFQVKITPYNTTHGCEEYTVTRLSEVSLEDNNILPTYSIDKAQEKTKDCLNIPERDYSCHATQFLL